ncbi:uncharacterized protein LOC135390586 isoform X2 [Ornithodoros turicata]
MLSLSCLHSGLSWYNWKYFWVKCYLELEIYHLCGSFPKAVVCYCLAAPNTRRAFLRFSASGMNSSAPTGLALRSSTSSLYPLPPLLRLLLRSLGEIRRGQRYNLNPELPELSLQPNGRTMISDVILFVTLMLNAGAVLNFNLKQNRDEIFVEKPSLGDKIREFLSTVQYLRAFIGIWNIFVMFLMLVFFGS